MLQRKSLAQEVAELIRQDIRSGIYAVDEKLPAEPELMKKFGVGRSTVREAIKFLTHSGFVNVLQGVGTRVVSTTGNASLEHTLKRSEFADLFEVRQLLEIRIAEKAALNRNDEQLQRMEAELQKRGQNAVDGQLDGCVKADVAFHSIMAESCGNHLLHELYKIISVQLTQFFIEQFTDTQTFLKSQPWHEELLAQVRAQNPAKALKIVNKIIGTV
ncbi:FadR/GntR family transcriptional regulator [Dyadobacter luticola]|uniref:FadR family transcriptional regulator n=1 Tax=Dyadobacter luticola TaxID=1979387 RepID=A0A5R9L4Y1_9BACT|nr:FadR/GntR family transcriptional regulator [Dyadobacter luticola]TLV03417.1 FadR family transcriptional regulator [Dyadobacter luticola]